MRGLTLFHGSNTVFDQVELSQSRNRRDFGRGFYTTTIRGQAENLSDHGGDRGSPPLPVVERELTATRHAWRWL
ncbi:MAG: DUF3990 domain-containing protein [Propionibacteriaceae bacterium]|nr:DUF3990 domain-containing protein [Propionibacteriaceae bacterium]